jgi:PAS domain S-box-containing protein
LPQTAGRESVCFGDIYGDFKLVEASSSAANGQDPGLGFDEALNAVPDAALVVSADGHILFGNRQSEALFGYSRSELLNVSIETLVPERFRDHHPYHRAEYAAAPRVRPMGIGLDLYALRKDGIEIPVEISLSPVSYGGASAVIASVRDVSVRHRLEEERAQALKQVQAIQVVSDAALASLAMDELVPQLLSRVRIALEADTAVIMLIDELGENLDERWSLGLEEESGSHVVVPLGSGFAGRVAVERRAIAADDVDSIETVNPVVRARGVRSLLGAPVILEDRVLGVLTVGSMQPRHFSGADSNLLQLVADRTALALDRARLYEESRSAVRMRNEFLSAISHDLGNPVAAIRLESRQLLESAGESCPLEIVEGLEQIEAAANRMWRQVEEILDLARLQVGRMLDLNWRRLDLVALIRELVYAEQATTELHTLHIETDEPVVMGEWDATRLERVITNLLSNAVKYSPEGGDITVAVSVERSTRQSVVIAVHDRGIGIPASDLPHIFQRFYRASNVRGRFAGTGIGLAGARRIVEAHGGELSLESVEGSGTSVTIRLPLDETSSTEDS